MKLTLRLSGNARHDHSSFWRRRNIFHEEFYLSMQSFVLRHTDWQWNKQVSSIFLASFIHGIRRIDNFLSLKMQKEIKCVHCFTLQLMELLNFILIGSIQWEMQSMNKTEYTKATGINKHDRSMGMLWYPTNHHNNLIVALLMIYLCCIFQLWKDMHLQLKSMKSIFHALVCAKN